MTGRESTAPHRMRRRWKIGSLVSSFAILALSASACGSGGAAAGSSQSGELSVGDFSPNIGNLNAYAALDEGFFKDHGLKVKLTQFTGGGAASIPAMVSGSAPVALAGTLDVTKAIRTKVLDAKFIGQETGFSYDIIAQKKYHSLKDLTHATWGVSGDGSQDEITIKATLKKAGLDPDEPNYIVAGTLSARFSALTAGKVDAIAFSSANRNTAEKAARVLVKDSASEVPFPTVPIVATTDVIKNRRPDLVKFMQALDQGTKWLKDPANHDKAIALCEKYTKSPEDVCNTGLDWQINDGGPGTWSDDLSVDVDGIGNALKALSTVYPEVSPDDPQSLVDNTIAQDAAAK